jgi:hypothetical protein
VLAIQTITPMGFYILLLNARTSRGTFAIGINLLTKRVSEKFSIITILLNKEKTLAILIPLTLLPKTTTSCEFKKG